MNVLFAAANPYLCRGGSGGGGTTMTVHWTAVVIVALCFLVLGREARRVARDRANSDQNGGRDE